MRALSVLIFKATVAVAKVITNDAFHTTIDDHTGALIELADPQALTSRIWVGSSSNAPWQPSGSRWGLGYFDGNPDVIIKRGTCVWPNEEAALNLIHSNLPPNAVPAPRVFFGNYEYGEDGVVSRGSIWMQHMAGKTLREVWPTLDETAKERVCRDTWAIIEKLREIPRPETHDGAFYLAADGTSKIIQTLLGDEHEFHPPMKNDEDLRARIWERYVKNNGLSYPEGKKAYDMLPRSEVSVFTHGDIHPRNILVEQDGERGSGVRITGLVDFESSGFYPDYWEFSEMMACGRKDAEWMEFMNRTKLKEWDISGIRLMRRVLF